VTSKVVDYWVDISFPKGFIKPFYQVNILLLWRGGVPFFRGSNRIKKANGVQGDA